MSKDLELRWELGPVEYVTCAIGAVMLLILHYYNTRPGYAYPPASSLHFVDKSRAQVGGNTNVGEEDKPDGPAQLKRASSVPVNLPSAGPLGLGILPAVVQVLKNGFLRSFLRKLYDEELARTGSYWLGMGGGYRSNSAVAHASEDPAMDTMNVAMPDLSAEYWCTFVPKGHAPIFRLSFPSWARYAALTAYDVSGLPVTSVNARQVHSDMRCFPLPHTDENTREFVVNLMWGCSSLTHNRWAEAPLCVIFRVYRPPSILMCPAEQLPRVRFVPHDWVDAEARLMEQQVARAAHQRVQQAESAAFAGGGTTDTFVSSPSSPSSFFRTRTTSEPGAIDASSWDGIGYNAVGFCMEDADLEDLISRDASSRPGNALFTSSLSSPSQDTDAPSGRVRSRSTNDDGMGIVAGTSLWSTGIGGIGIYCEHYLPQAPRDLAMANGRRFGRKFSDVISSKLKELEKVKFGVDEEGSQFFHPKNVAGLFVNANATYVVAFLPAGKRGMRIR